MGVIGAMVRKGKMLMSMYVKIQMYAKTESMRQG